MTNIFENVGSSPNCNSDIVAYRRPFLKAPGSRARRFAPTRGLAIDRTRAEATTCLIYAFISPTLLPLARVPCESKAGIGLHTKILACGNGPGHRPFVWYYGTARIISSSKRVNRAICMPIATTRTPEYVRGLGPVNWGAFSTSPSPQQQRRQLENWEHLHI